jgi:beta-lactam-binding protein with PASTA domain
VVPNVIGQKLAKARARITRRHCRVGKVIRKHSTLAMKGRVIAQSPKASARKRQNGFRIRLTVGKGR